MLAGYNYDIYNKDKKQSNKNIRIDQLLFLMQSVSIMVICNTPLLSS